MINFILGMIKQWIAGLIVQTQNIKHIILYLTFSFTLFVDTLVKGVGWLQSQK